MVVAKMPMARAAAIFLLSSALIWPLPVGAVSLAPIATTSGQVVGQRLPDGAKAWLGIPYAKPPTGALRWSPPQSNKWTGIWNADRFGPECIQFLRPHSLNNYFGEEASSEDCLTVNIWTPGKGARNLPVIVFIHGGGGTAGSSAMPNYRGDNLARRGAVVVTFNYRLGLLGYLSHPDLTREQGGHSGDYGYLDQVAAMRWVHANIARFGGDPSHILLYGNSSGGNSVFLHLFSPLTKGLFTSAMLASACCDLRETSLAEAEKVGAALQTALGVSDLEAMRNVAADRILSFQADGENPSTGVKLRGVTVIDGYFLDRPLAETLQRNQVATMPILWSSTARDNDWGRHPLAAVRTAADYIAIVDKIYGGKAKQFLALYPAAADGDVALTVARLVQDGGMQGANRRCAELFRNSGKRSAPMFLALYDHSEPFAPGVRFSDRDTTTAGAFHNSDTPYWLGGFEGYNVLRTTRLFTAADRAMSAAMSDMMIAFAKTGNPSIGSVRWPAWSFTNESRLVLGRDMRSEQLAIVGMDWLANNPISAFATLPCGTLAAAK